MMNRVRIIIAALGVLIIISSILVYMGEKFEQQDRLYIRSELSKLDSQLREIGVNICFIQPLNKELNNFVVMLYFWEVDYSKKIKNLENIKNVIFEYIRKLTGNKILILKYVDEDGFNLEDTLKAKMEVELSVTQPEYYEIVKKYTTELQEKLKNACMGQIEPQSYHSLIIADVKYDVTLDTYGAKKQFYFARFNNATTQQLRAIRILYKKLSNFDASRGDAIYFYNLNHLEFRMIEMLRIKMKQEIQHEIKAQTIIFEPVKDWEQFGSYHILELGGNPSVESPPVTSHDTSLTFSPNVKGRSNPEITAEPPSSSTIPFDSP